MAVHPSIDLLAHVVPDLHPLRTYREKIGFLVNSFSVPTQFSEKMQEDVVRFAVNNLLPREATEGFDRVQEAVRPIAGNDQAVTLLASSINVSANIIRNLDEEGAQALYTALAPTISKVIEVRGDADFLNTAAGNKNTVFKRADALTEYSKSDPVRYEALAPSGTARRYNTTLERDLFHTAPGKDGFERIWIAEGDVRKLRINSNLRQLLDTNPTSNTGDAVQEPFRTRFVRWVGNFLRREI